MAGAVDRAALAPGARRAAAAPDPRGPGHGRRADLDQGAAAAAPATLARCLDPHRHPHRQRADPGPAADHRAAGLPGAVPVARSAWPAPRRTSTATGATSRSTAGRRLDRVADRLAGRQRPAVRQRGAAAARHPARLSRQGAAAAQRRRRASSTRRAEPQRRHDGSRAREARDPSPTDVDFAAIAVLIVAAVAVTGYILEHQPSFTFGQSYYTVKAEFSTAAAVTGGQGQAVTIAGVQVGQVGGVSLQDGRAVVTMNIYKQYAPIYRNATVLLRPRTPLKDMYLALDPGTESAGAVPAGGTLGTGQHPARRRRLRDPLLARRRHPQLPAPAAVRRRRGVPRSRLRRRRARARARSPTCAARSSASSRSTATPRTFASLLATRQRNIRRAIHNLNLVAGALGGVDEPAGLADQRLGHQLLGDLRQRRPARGHPDAVPGRRCGRPRPDARQGQGVLDRQRARR